MRRRISMALAALAALSTGAQAAQLGASTWKVTDLATGADVARAVTDNDIRTRWSGDAGKGLLIDLGAEAAVHRVYLTPGAGDPITEVRIAFMRRPDEAGAPTRGYRVPDCDWSRVQAERSKLRAAGTDDFLPGEPDADLKFDPLPARYLRITGPKAVAELEVYGSLDRAALTKRDAVVVAADAPELLRLAAEELRYYVGELTGRPLPIIAPSHEDEYPGTLYRIENLRPLARSWDEMVAGLRAGKLPTGGPLPASVISLYTGRLPDGVNVERDGRAVVFRAWPYRNVLHSVWEFLRRQGVVWAYPGSHGDFVPAGRGVDLGILPLKCRPSADCRKANFDVGSLKEYPYIRYPYTDDFLFFVRNGYESSWGIIERFMGQHGEVPPVPELRTMTRDEVPEEHAEGFAGYPHNFAAVMPNRILEKHTDWCGMRADGERLPPHKGGPGTFCLTSPGAVEFVADKMLAWAGGNRDCAAKFDLLPMDGTTYCLCERCEALCRPHERTEIPYVPLSPFSVSGAYYHFVAEVAARVAVKAPHVRIGALAYADVHAPPRKIGRLPGNVWVEVVQYGSRNLPMSSPANAAMRRRMVEWSRACGHLTNYEYALIHGEWAVPPMPIPLVGAIVDRSKFLHALGAWNGGTQSHMKCLPHNPWNHYAYPRMLWDVTLAADRIEEEFFSAYYREAGSPMRAYYRALEGHIIRENVDLQDFGYDQGPHPDAFPPALVERLRAHLADAAARARSWYVKERIETARRDLEWGAAMSARRSMDLRTALAHGKRSYLCRRRRGAITIDGDLNDEGWAEAPVATDFLVPGSDERVPDPEQTEFRMLWDDRALYLAVRLANPKAASLKETDAVWGTDNFEWFLVPGRAYTRTAVYQTAVSAFGKAFGPVREIHDQWHRDVDWRAEDLLTAVRRGEGRWTCEAALPFSALAEGAPKAGDAWRVNVCRNRGSGVERASSWSPLIYAMWHSYRDFSPIVFEGGPAARARP